MAREDDDGRIEPTFGPSRRAGSDDAPADDADFGRPNPDADFGRPKPTVPAVYRGGAAGGGASGGWRPFAFGGTIAATALVAAFIGAMVNDALRPQVAVGQAGSAGMGDGRLDELSADIDALRTVLDSEMGRIGDRLTRLEGGEPAPYTPPRRVDGDQRSASEPATAAPPEQAAATSSEPEFVAAVTPPAPRARPEPPPRSQPLGAPPADLGTLPASDAPTVIYAPDSPNVDVPPRRFGGLGAGNIAPRAAPPMPIPGASDEAQPIPGWQVRDVIGGRAIIDGGFIGTFEVEPGMELPEIGVVEQIYRGSGGWVVATSRGIITSGP